MPPPSLPALEDQAERLVALGVHELAGVPAATLRDSARGTSGLLVLSASLVPPSALAPLLRRRGRAGFVVTDMDDLNAFATIPGAAAPDAPTYVVAAPDRGDEMAGWGPNEALPAIIAAGRSPLTVSEGSAGCCSSPTSSSATAAS